MQLNEDLTGGSFISNYKPGAITVAGIVYHENILITPDGTVQPWLAELTQCDLAKCHELLAFKPELIIIGTGEQQQLPDITILKFFAQHKIGVEMMSTAAACRTYNVVLSENRKVVAGFIVS